jgi:hypothetical protein
VGWATVRRNKLANESERNVLDAMAAWFAAFPPFDAVEPASLAYLARHVEIT